MSRAMSIEQARLPASRRARVLAHLRTHPILSWTFIGVFIVYLPFLYQISLNLVAANVMLCGGRLCWATSGFWLFPFPFDAKWVGSPVLMMIVPLSPADVYIYTSFCPSIAPRVMWSVLSLTIGFTYIIWPLLSSPRTKDATVSTNSN